MEIKPAINFSLIQTPSTLVHLSRSPKISQCMWTPTDWCEHFLANCYLIIPTVWSIKDLLFLKIIR